MLLLLNLRELLQFPETPPKILATLRVSAVMPSCPPRSSWTQDIDLAKYMLLVFIVFGMQILAR